MKRYSIVELTKTTDDELLLEIVSHYSNSLVNPYTALAVRIKSIRNKLADRIQCSLALKAANASKKS